VGPKNMAQDGRPVRVAELPANSASICDALVSLRQRGHHQIRSGQSCDKSQVVWCADIYGAGDVIRTLRIHYTHTREGHRRSGYSQPRCGTCERQSAWRWQASLCEGLAELALLVFRLHISQGTVLPAGPHREYSCVVVHRREYLSPPFELILAP
jgi:hypothetical protein